MIPEKEHLIILEEYAKKQKQIFPTSADVGVYIKDQDLYRIKESLKKLKLFYGGRNWSCNTAKMDQGAVNNIMIPFEIEGSMARGVTVSVNVVLVKKRSFNSRYATITIDPLYTETTNVPCLINDEVSQ